MLRKKTIITISLLVIGIILWFIGGYLQRIYGFEPPYYYMYAGTIIQLIGFLCILAFGFTLLFIFMLKFKKEKEKEKVIENEEEE